MPVLTPSFQSAVLIPCKISQGMFSTEAAVELSFEGKTVSLFADRDFIVERAGQAYLRVKLVGENGKPANKTVLLPTEAFESGSSWLSVPEREIVPL